MLNEYQLNSLSNYLDAGRELWVLDPNNKAHRCVKVEDREAFSPIVRTLDGYVDLNNIGINSFMVPFDDFSV